MAGGYCSHSLAVCREAHGRLKGLLPPPLSRPGPRLSWGRFVSTMSRVIRAFVSPFILCVVPCPRRLGERFRLTIILRSPRLRWWLPMRVLLRGIPLGLSQMPAYEPLASASLTVAWHLALAPVMGTRRAFLASVVLLAGPDLRLVELVSCPLLVSGPIASSSFSACCACHTPLSAVSAGLLAFLGFSALPSA